MVSTLAKEKSSLSYIELRRSLRVPRVHPNGFVQLSLNDEGTKRLHIWPDTPIEVRAVAMPIHDHIYNFESTVIVGALWHLVYEIEQNPQGDYRVYNVFAQSTKKDAPLERMDDCRYNARLVEKLCITAGEEYSFERFRFHESIPVGFTATIFSTSDFNPIDKPRLLCPANETYDNSFRRDSSDPEFLWSIIKRVCD